MKRFLIVLTALILGYLAYDTVRYYLGWYIDLQPDVPVSAFMSTTRSTFIWTAARDRRSSPSRA